jgi:hypothetical protein
VQSLGVDPELDESDDDESLDELSELLLESLELLLLLESLDDEDSELLDDSLELLDGLELEESDVHSQQSSAKIGSPLLVVPR